jgi:hypothetical protein
MELNTVLTHGLTYLAALALPLWLLGEQLAAWWVLRKKTETSEIEQTPANLEPPARLERKAA